MYSRNYGRGDISAKITPPPAYSGSAIQGKENADIICDNRNICFTERILDDGSRVVDILNVSANCTTAEEYKLTLNDGRILRGKAYPGSIEHMNI